MATETQTVPAATLPKYQQPAETKYNLDWAEFVTLDLSQFDAPSGKQKLANQLRNAVHEHGFFYVINFGLTQDEVDQQFAIGKVLFELPLEEKMKHPADVEHGSYNGYRPQGTREQFPGLRDNVEMYNLFKLNGKLERSQPDIILKNRALIENFQQHLVNDIVKKLLVLIAIVLEMPEASLLNGHDYEDISDCHLRYMLYHARSPEVNAKYGNVYAGGHTDFGTISLLFRQPIAGLQIRMSDGSWKWVKPRPESITVNIADALQFWSAGYLKSSVHRVVTPPDDQAHLDRLGLLYFVRPAHDLELKTLDSPLLKRLGLKGEMDDAPGIKAGDWVKKRVAEDVQKAVEGGHKELTVLGGVKVRYYQS
ncbi:2OG-Fe(II) oxygenase superfamily protein [Hyaloscypha variabilis F]|uniref:2OG-Fe(II) oxygenase superfamily protein n=1 Tax=Hyaloscypha variabilis (strain UAMH 11265 / GT02V1 / F) TaxID=1149755 RepID=A0A2J6RTL3_HYAVF|nr:2OG-Fe(II) oxygenase superfamily protein [Hyaloscypha variabilis F]